jgi:hypothetical protein
VTDEHGRIVDGRIDGTGVAFTIVSDYSDVNGAIEIRRHDTNTYHWLLAPSTFRRFSGPAELWEYANRNDLAADLEADARGSRAIGDSPLSMTFFKGCRDVNPASLHMTLVGLLAESLPSKQSFVVEMSRAHEVWNHPVWGYRSSVGTPRSVSLDPEGVREFRAPGTAFVADVDTRVIYTYGSTTQYDHAGEATGPINWDHFDRFPERYGVLRLRYSLEFDADGLVIGGEWDRRQRTDESVPDFVWRTFGTLTDRRKSDGQPSVLKYSVLKSLLTCSHKPADTTRDVMIGGAMTRVDAATCQL